LLGPAGKARLAIERSGRGGHPASRSVSAGNLQGIRVCGSPDEGKPNGWLAAIAPTGFPAADRHAAAFFDVEEGRDPGVVRQPGVQTKLKFQSIRKRRISQETPLFLKTSPERQKGNQQPLPVAGLRIAHRPGEVPGLSGSRW
jgi:hypothetical protein